MEDMKPKRTKLQNRALHLYFTQLAEILNEAGLDMVKVLEPGVEIPWNADMIKNCIWRPVQIAQLDKTSTTELTTKEIDQVFEVINKHIGQKFGVHIPWPSIEEIMTKLRMQDEMKNLNLN